VLIGAGSLQFGFDTLGDIFQSEVLPGSRIVLHDINSAASARPYTAGTRN
jgi:alpha-galactosidase/6-phospho-beta-glucosidase family protein